MIWLLWSAAPVAAGPPSYQLFFVPPTPLPPNVTEGVGSVTFAVQLQDACVGAFTPVIWDVATVATGSADNSDFGPPSVPSLVFSQGDLTQIFTVPIIADGQTEGPETFDIMLTPGPGDVNLNCIVPELPPSMPMYGLTVTIDDAGPPLPVLSIDDATVIEGDAGMVDAEITVHLSNPSLQAVQVDYATVDGTASNADEDYTPTSGTLIFSPGVTTRSLMVPILGDTQVEPDEAFLVQLSMPVNATIGDSQAAVTIENDDQPDPPGLSIDDVMVIEGDAGTTDAVFTVTLDRDTGTPGTVTVSYATLDGTATAADDDYEPASGTLTFEPADTVQTVTVAVIGDTRIEGDESFFVDLSAPVGAVISDGRGRGGIRDDDMAAPPVISISDVTVDEADGPTNAVFQVALSRPSAMTVTVDYETADGTAIAGEDYQARAGTLSFPPGQISASFNVVVLGDTEEEPDEVFLVNLLDPAGAVLGDAQGRALIRDDDTAEPSLIRFVRDRQTVMEGAGAAEIAVERTGGASGAAAVIVTTVSGTAQAGQDYETRRQAVSWQPGELGRKLVAVPIVDDNLEEADEALGLRLIEAAGAQLAAPQQTVLAIIDDDTPIRLEAVGDQELTVQAREELDLQVLASRMDGSPVAGATVVWRVEGRAELLGPEERQSDDEGLSTARVRADRMPGQAVVVARLQGTDSAVSFALTIEGDLSGLIGGPPGLGDDDDVAQVLDQGCGTATGELLQLCDFLFGIDDDGERLQALEALTPRNAVAQGNAALRAPRVQLRNIGGRLNALRGGSSRLVTADLLSFSIQGDTLALGTLRPAFGKKRRGVELDQLLDDALHGRPPSLASEAASPEPDLESPWGFFINGRASFGDAPGTDLESGYDFETQGLTAGIDYRASNRFVLGLGLGYLGTDLDLAGDGGDLEVTGTSLSLYTTWYTRRFYVDGVLGYGWNDYRMQRFINLPRQFQGQSRRIATGEPEGNQLSLDLGLGYDFSLGRSTLGGFLRASLIDAEVDAFSETGAGPFDLLFSNQEIESLQSEAGLEISRPVSLRWGVLLPSLRLSYLHEFEDDRRIIRARFRSDALGRPFAVLTDTPDRDFLNLGAGVTITLPRSMATYLTFDTDLERDDLDIYTLSGGFRMQF